MEKIVYGLDIETDTSPSITGEPKGLNPANTKIINIALSSNEKIHILRGNEIDLLASLDQILRILPSGIISTWNGSVFDLPFILDRAMILGVKIGLVITHDPDILPKYKPLPGHLGGYKAFWERDEPQPHQHFDVAYALRDSAYNLNIEWSLKKFSAFFGLNPVEVERSAIHKLTPDEQDLYVASDAKVTRELAIMYFQKYFDK